MKILSRLMKIVLLNALLTLLLITIFDVATFSFLPVRYVSRLTQYRRSSPPDAVGHARYPNGYFIEHDDRGFDIGINKQGDHWVDGITYPIWSNSFGCFDNEHTEDGRYVYFAGDSLTWGYSPFEHKFGTIIERLTGTKIFKCGVSHTGQLHQFDKFVEIMDQAGRPPTALFVFYYFNDMANDYAYPHTTVVDGWLVNDVFLDDDGELVRQTRQELNQRIKETLDRNEHQEQEEESGWLRTLKFYSLSLNLIDYFDEYTRRIVSKPAGEANSADESTPRFKGIYQLPQEKNGRLWYLDNPGAEENKAALVQFDSFSTEKGTDLVVVLVPPKERVADTGWYAELRSFLTRNEIRYIDLTANFRDMGLAPRDLYWIHDGHLSPSGNEVVAEILIDEFPDVFRR